MSNAPATILNVNDDEVGRYAITRILQNAGFHVLEAANGTEAIALAKTHPELIVLDVQLPDISGFEVCQRLKSDPATAPIAILHLSASFIGSQDKAYGLESGADGYLTQPVEAPVLIAHIKALLRMRHAEETAQEKAVQWQATFDSICDGIILLDSARRILQCNRAMAELLRKPLKALQGQLLTEAADAAPEFLFLQAYDRTEHDTAQFQIGEHWFQVTSDPIRHGFPSRGSVHVLTDITQRKQAEEENIRLLLDTRETAVRQRAFMRDILSSVTGGKLRLCDSAEDLPAGLQQVGEALDLKADSLSALRAAVRQALTVQGFSEERIEDMLTAVSEAGMNAVVHAGGGTGTLFIDPSSGIAQVRVQDCGTGIAVDRLPQATLQRGYTTAGTLGHGFKMMLQTADRVWLLTGVKGTTVVIEQERVPPMALLA